MKKISPLDFQSQTKVSNEIKCNFLKTSYFFVGQYEMQTFPIIEILRDSKKRFFSSISCPSLPRGIHIISNVLLMLFQSMAISFLQTGSLWPLMRTSAVPPEWSIIALVIQIPAVTAMGGGQRSFGTFLKIHPFWWRHPSLSICFIFTNLKHIVHLSIPIYIPKKNSILSCFYNSTFWGLRLWGRMT